MTVCLPKPLPSKPGPRRAFVGALVVALLSFVTADIYAQVTPSSFSIMRVLDGTALVNPGDTANSAIRVNVVAGSAGGPSKVDDAAFTIATDSVVPIGMLADQTSPDSVNEGDVGLARMTLARIALHTIWDAAGNERGVNVTAANQAEVAVTAALPAGTNAIGKLAANSGVDIGDVDVASLPALPAGANAIGTVGLTSISSANEPGKQVSVTTTSASILASFSTRKGASICASPLNTDVIHIKLGATATTSNGKLFAGQCFNTGPVVYTGVIDSRSASGTQEATAWEW